MAELVGEQPLLRRPGPRRTQLEIQGALVTRREDIPQDKLPPFWRESLQSLLQAYHRVCAYLCVYIEPLTGGPTVDHMIPKSRAWDRVYEWDNYRLACSPMNARKNDMQDVLDPFEIETGWFQLELVGFQVIPNSELPHEVRVAIIETIRRLQLNDHQCRQLRIEYAVSYWEGEISWLYLQRRAPFVALELDRQGRR